MSYHSPYIIDDNDDEASCRTDRELEILSYDSDTSEPEVLNRTSPTETRNPNRHHPASWNDTIELPDVEVQDFKFGNINVKNGSTVELKDFSTGISDVIHGGDFVHVKRIIQNLETDELRFQGHRMRRTKYLGQIFDWKLNELCMVLPITEGNNTCPFVAGMEDFAVEDVVGVRECVFTNKTYPLESCRYGDHFAYPASMSKEEIRRQIFKGGRLTCRVVMIISKRETKKNTKMVQKFRSGIIRRLYASETVTPGISTPRTPSSDTGQSRATSIVVHDDDEDDVIIVSPRNRHVRSASLEFLGESPSRRPVPHPKKAARFTFGDVFCGGGGGSQGAIQAGLNVVWGLDKDELALRAYRMNHRGASAFLCDAHNFPPPGTNIAELRVDILHLSPPCCFFAPCHTVDGPRDQANLEALYTVGGILKKVKPRIATLEQTFGLVSFDKHMKYFYLLLNDIGKAGYDVRYKIQDLSKHGLVQKRKRLLIIAARRGTPLPPFPKETHGPSGSGLKPFVFIDEAIGPLERMGRRATWNDQYHQPRPATNPREATNPKDFLKGCITTGGSDSYHYSGLRKWTPRELSLFQSFPYGYKFTGSNTEATKQIGNAFPPVMAEAMYRTIIKTLEAFDNGLIDAEEPIFDIDETIRKKNGSRSRRKFQGRTFRADEEGNIIVLDD